MTPTVTISRELAVGLLSALDERCPAFDQLHDELRAALDAPASSGWRPISDTPPELTDIVAWDGYDSHVAQRYGNDYGREDMKGISPRFWHPLPPPPGDDVGTTDAIQWSEDYAGCTYHRCIREKGIRLGAFPLSSARMIVCPECGNKRCPHASDHDLACTGSNAPGQPGSVYPKAITDSDRLDWLESKGNGTPWIARESSYGRGYRLINTLMDGASNTVREAIDAAIKQDKP